MGGMLTSPVTNKRSDQGEGLGLRYGLSSMQGWRSEMEDAHDVKIGLQYGLDDWSFFAVFDGHAGKRAAAFAAWNLLDFILKDNRLELQNEYPPETSYIEPDIENFHEFPRVENNSNQPPNESSNGGHDNMASDVSEQSETVNKKDDEEASKQKTNSDQSTEAVAGKQSVESHDQGPSSNKEVEQPESYSEKDDTKGGGETKSSDGQKPPKPKFVSLPILKQLDLVENAIKSGFLRIDNKMRLTAKDMSGCTAVCALISPTHLFIANCGDSRAVLYDGTSPKFVTEDHKPFNPKERQRIIEAGGCATQRINGTLAVSRALGDFEFKKDLYRGPCEQLVSPEPEVTVIPRNRRDEFLILACDGIWDVMDNNDLCKFIRYKLQVEPKLEEVCSSVLDVCLHKGSRDNMSIIIVVFESGPKFSELELERDKKNDELLTELAKSAQERACYSTFNEFVSEVFDEGASKLFPPGAGFEAKYDLLRDIFEKSLANTPETKEN